MVIEQVDLPQEPVLTNIATLSRATSPLVRRVGRLRLPVAGPYHPWATLYRFPDGRTFWVLRLWEVDRVVRRCVSTTALRSYAAHSGLPRVLAAIDRLLAEPDRPDDPRR